MSSLKYLLSMFLLAACTMDTHESITQHMPSENVSLNQKWQPMVFQQFSFNENHLSSSLFLDLSQLPQAHAFVGCNQISLQVSAADQRWRAQNVVMTRMYCQELQALETAFTQTLTAADAYEIKGNQLILKKQQKEIMRLRAIK